MKCLCYPMSSMKLTDQIETSFTTNIAESAHALLQKYRKQLTLISAIQARQKLNSQYFELDKIIRYSRVNAVYSNRSAIGRARQSLNRQRAKSRAEAIKKAKKDEVTEIVLKEARILIEKEVSKEAIEEFLSAQSKS